MKIEESGIHEREVNAEMKKTMEAYGFHARISKRYMPKAF